MTIGFDTDIETYKELPSRFSGRFEKKVAYAEKSGECDPTTHKTSYATKSGAFLFMFKQIGDGDGSRASSRSAVVAGDHWYGRARIAPQDWQKQKKAMHEQGS